MKHHTTNRPKPIDGVPHKRLNTLSHSISSNHQLLTSLTLSSVLLSACGGVDVGEENITAKEPSRSTTIAITSDDQRLVVVNRQKFTISVIRVKDNVTTRPLRPQVHY